ncbi:MAG: DNA translocase FtsK [Planctomycetaceae bacterium]|nr:DNA translocase FtsK [Planctomycetaceae bacterium]
MLNYQRIQNDLLAVAMTGATAFVGMSLLSYSAADPPSTVSFPPPAEIANLCGPVGASLAHALWTFSGIGVWLILVAMISVTIALFKREEVTDRVSRWLGGFLIALAGCMGIQLLFPGMITGPVYGSGGYLGAIGAMVLLQEFSWAGSLTLIGSMLVGGLMLASETYAVRALAAVLAVPAKKVTQRFTPYYLRFQQKWAARREERLERKRLKAEEHRLNAERMERENALKINQPLPVVKPSEVLAMPLAVSSASVPATITHPTMPVAEGVWTEEDESESRYQLPSTTLLAEPEEFPYELLAENAAKMAATLEQTFEEFKLNIKVVEIETGPVVTQFELELEKGLRLSKVTSLADDLAIALRVPSVRVVAPIPGKNTVGVEVPNEKTVTVRLRELLEVCQEDISKLSIPVLLGKDVSGRPVSMDMAKMPHLLIAGRTGTGKSVCLNTLILSILMTRTPDQVKMLMIDPKMVELSPYKKVPHLMHPVITDMKKAEAALEWAVEKMEERYTLLARTGVRHLDTYNQLGKEEVLDRLGIAADSVQADDIPEHMPYIVIIADEMADMMMTSGKDVEGHIIRLAQKSRAVGIHLVLATQKPTVDVITGLIKSNLPARIAFQVASRTDSRVVLDEMGADKLLGNGDMLFLAPGTSNLTRAQGTYVSDDEVNEIIDFYSRYEPQYSEELRELGKSNESGPSGSGGERIYDDMYKPAIEVVIREGRGSVSLLQRALGIGYGRAARLVDYMAEDGVVGEYNGSQARDVMYTMEQWEAIQNEELEMGV